MTVLRKASSAVGADRLSPGATYDAAVLVNTPYAYWLLEDASGTSMLDASGNGRNATLSGSGYTQAVAGPGATRALNLGANGYVDTGISFSSATQLTYECLVKIPSASGQVAFAACRNGSTPGILFGTNYGVSPPGSGKLVAGWDVDSAWIGRKDTTTAINDDTWHHVVLAWKATNPAGSILNADFKIYLDGVQVDDSNDTYNGRSAPLTSTTLYIGNGRTQGGIGDFTVTRFALYMTALTADQIAAHADAVVTL